MVVVTQIILELISQKQDEELKNASIDDLKNY